MDDWLCEIDFYERVVMTKARTSRALTDGDLDRMVGWSVFADKSWAHTAGLGPVYQEVVGGTHGSKSSGSKPPPPSFRLLSAIANNAFLPSDTVHKGQCSTMHKFEFGGLPWEGHFIR